jgi:hypothetical protein
MPYTINEYSLGNQRICAGRTEGKGWYVVRLWGMDRTGEQVNLLLTFDTLKAARSAIAAALFKYGARARFWISS